MKSRKNINDKLVLRYIFDIEKVGLVARVSAVLSADRKKNYGKYEI